MICYAQSKVVREDTIIEKQDKPYDSGSKRLLALCAQDFLDWLAQGAVFTGKRSEAFQSIAIDADILHEVLWYEKLGLVHLEIQSGPDANMEQRLLEYNVLAYRRYKCFVNSYVIFLRDGGDDLHPPLVHTSADGSEGLTFHYKVILMREIPYEALLAQAPRGIWPFIPFARGGAQREVVEEIITRLTPVADSETKELLTLACFFAELAFPNQEDKEWIKRRKAMLDDFLRESSIYQGILEEGREEGSILASRKTLLALFDERFPRLNMVVSKTLPTIKKAEILQQLIIKIAVAKNEKEARKYLLEAAQQHG